MCGCGWEDTAALCCWMSSANAHTSVWWSIPAICRGLASAGPWRWRWQRRRLHSVARCRIYTIAAGWWSVPTLCRGLSSACWCWHHSLARWRTPTIRRRRIYTKCVHTKCVHTECAWINPGRARTTRIHIACVHTTSVHTTCGCADTACVHTTSVHTTCAHTTRIHTPCVHTTSVHTTCPHTTRGRRSLHHRPGMLHCCHGGLDTHVIACHKADMRPSATGLNSMRCSARCATIMGWRSTSSAWWLKTTGWHGTLSA